jgi:four helix bundle protein
MSERISSFKDLRVYKLAFELQQEIFEASKRFPTEERYALTDQIRRASRSIGANLSEAWQKRLYIAHFVSKLTDADGEQAETRHWLDTATACDYISEREQKAMLEKCSRIGQMLGTMMADPDKWCHKADGGERKRRDLQRSSTGPPSSAVRRHPSAVLTL